MIKQLLASISFIFFSIGFTLADLEKVASILFFFVGMVLAIISFFTKYKEAKKDGVITPEEKKNLLKEFDKIKDEVVGLVGVIKKHDQDHDNHKEN